MVERYQTLVIGGGMAGLPLALRAARHGRVAFVEKEKLGGTCLNRGCIPTKTMIASAEVAHQVRRAAEFGVRVGDPVVDLSAVVARKDEIVESIRDGSYRAVERAESVDHYPAQGRFVGPRRLRVEDTELEADRIFLVTGMRTTVPPIEGLGGVPYHTSRTLLDLTELPEHLVVVGGGYIGCEFAQMFRRFGSRVTLVQRAERLLPVEDPDISDAVTDGFGADGTEVRTGTTCVAVAGWATSASAAPATPPTRSAAATCSSPRAGRPTPTGSGSTSSAWNRPVRGSCPWTTRCAPRWRTCGHWATSGVGGYSPTPRATTRTSSTAPCSATRTAASRGGSSRTRCSSIPRSARSG